MADEVRVFLDPMKEHLANRMKLLLMAQRSFLLNFLAYGLHRIMCIASVGHEHSSGSNSSLASQGPRCSLGSISRRGYSTLSCS